MKILLITGHRRRIAAFGVLMVLIGAGTGAQAHSWYPYECCDDEDCAPVENIEKPDFGRISIMTTKHGRIIVPNSFPRRASPDHRMHLCVFQTPMGLIPRCLFVPGTS